MNLKIAALVVTHNRKQLLFECLESLVKQTVILEKIIVIDNASTDGTQTDFWKSKYSNLGNIIFCEEKQNIGGSGGFYEGIKMFSTLSCDAVWLMDDDTIPKLDSLEKLVDAYSILRADLDKEKSTEEIAFLSSAVYGPEGEPMNVPTISKKRAKNGYEFWYQKLRSGIVQIDSATFVSMFILKSAINVVGLPCKDYFIWGDDTEYSLRLAKYYGNGYLVGPSEVIHKRIGAKPIDIEKEDDLARMKLYSYFYRNTLINTCFYGQGHVGRIRLHSLVQCFFFLVKHLFKKNGFRKSAIVFRGTFQGIFQYRKFKQYIQSQICQNQ